MKINSKAKSNFFTKYCENMCGGEISVLIRGDHCIG
jgi:hypothetical protein